MVFLSHAGTQRISGGLLYQFTTFGEAAVDVFFVLSGFLIAQAATYQDAGGYAIARAARLYSVVLPCLALGWLMDLTGPALDPMVYAAAPFFTGSAGAMQLASSLLFLDHNWFRHAQPGSNLPYWSLCFEAWYYLAFGLLVFAKPPWNWLGAMMAMLAAGPKIALLFPLWLLGVACQRRIAHWASTGGGVSRTTAWALLLGPVAAWGALHAWDPVVRGCYPFMQFEPGLECLVAARSDYAIGLVVAAQILGVHALAPTLWRWLRPLARPASWLAGASFTLYLLHDPLLHFIVATAPWPPSHWATRALVFLLPPLVVLAVAEGTERRRRAWRHALLSIARLLRPA